MRVEVAVALARYIAECPLPPCAMEWPAPAGNYRGLGMALAPHLDHIRNAVEPREHAA